MKDKRNTMAQWTSLCQLVNLIHSPLLQKYRAILLVQVGLMAEQANEILVDLKFLMVYTDHLVNIFTAFR